MTPKRSGMGSWRYSLPVWYGVDPMFRRRSLKIPQILEIHPQAEDILRIHFKRVLSNRHSIIATHCDNCGTGHGITAIWKGAIAVAARVLDADKCGFAIW
jgi:hypothetical protein